MLRAGDGEQGGKAEMGRRNPETPVAGTRMEGRQYLKNQKNQDLSRSESALQQPAKRQAA